MTETITIPLNKLLAWDGNVRKTDADKGIDELAASITAHGLLQSLVVRKDKRGKFAVVAGRRRLLALQSLAEGGSTERDCPVPCQIIGKETDAAEISLAENVQREPMHPADEFDAFKALVENGMPLADVAARFGVTETVVKQRLKLANVSRALIAAYRAGEMSLQHVMAFAVSDDHAAQERVWNDLSDWQRDKPEVIRNLLTNQEITADDLRVKFVTLEAYQEAGGTVRRDLFSDDEHGVFIDDLVLLESLVAKKLDAIADRLRAQGWKWVEIVSTFDYDEWSKCERRSPEPLPLLLEQQQELDALTAEADALGECDELDDEQQERLDILNERIDELDNRATVWPEETLAIAGAVVSIGFNGEADIRYGFIRPEDAPKGTGKSGRGKACNVSNGADQDRSALPASLTESLTAHRSAALNAALIERSDVALAAVVHALARPVFYGGASDHTALQVTMKAGSLHRIEGSPARAAIQAALEAWGARLPCNPDDLFAWCLAEDADTLKDLLAFCVAQTVNAVQLKTDPSDSPRLVHAGQLAKALNLDMTAWFTPTAANYFGKVSKAAIIETIREAKGATAPAWSNLKRSELASLAERQIAGTGWLPEPLRAGGPLPEATNLAA